MKVQHVEIMEMVRNLESREDMADLFDQITAWIESDNVEDMTIAEAMEFEAACRDMVAGFTFTVH